MIWVATGAPGMFPRLEATLTAWPLGPDQVLLVLEGGYEPPFGAVGRALDRVVLHRIAEATVACFLDRLAEALAGPEVPPPPAAGPARPVPAAVTTGSATDGAALWAGPGTEDWERARQAESRLAGRRPLGQSSRTGGRNGRRGNSSSQ